MSLFEAQTYEEILQRLKSKVPSEIDTTEGSFIHDALSPAALEIAQLYTSLDLVLTLAFAQTTSGQYLDYRAGEHGLTRKAAVKAAGIVKVTGNPGVAIGQGTIFLTDGGIGFESTKAAVIQDNGSVDISVQAAEEGITGNVPAGAVKTLQVALQGVTEITNESAITGGTDQESDEDLLSRLLLKVRNPATSGNAAHYLQWAGEVSGVGDAKVFPLWDGAGTVKVVIVDSEKIPAEAEIVVAAAAYIESMRPVGAEVTVESAAGVDINVAATVTLAENYTLGQVTDSFRALLTDHLKDIAFKQDYVSFARIGSTLLETPGILDHTGLMVNGGTANIAIGITFDNCQVAVAGTVTLA
ncbi:MULTISPECIES: baseplate J/gp47 family protein [unclassified Dehalobacter]|uniref:baseplate J/gp47 family protein n=1 Tax=unclassified Dehalobacter TaxID=2635733 RepID=UPI000E6BFB75|nr:MULTISPECIES: baseplate J/gp47 family protein [unclassified Dehalobacter]RJE48696.1 baseplate j family protein [Dehalobacter sp. MCB1]TCX53387.1 baseplate j family protein [Dehalobacter sp. 14DCB1]TCX54402.1 baseplate j family protein [Dehalobacter sp. 12DCB1]